MFTPAFRSRLKTARSVCALTGAGISAESGVPTFRGPDGLWRKYRPEELATPEAFRRDPALVWEWYLYRRELIRKVAPNRGHEALVTLERHFPELTVVTQNVDGLHRQAGSRNLIELHGNIMKSFCQRCREPWAAEVSGVTRCRCGGAIRPGVVWFGESLPEGAMEAAANAAARADLFLCIGTAGVVYPAASMPSIASQAGAFVVEINPERTGLSPMMTEVLLGKAGEILPRIVEALGL